MRLINYTKHLSFLLFIVCSNVLAGGYYYPAPVNPQPLQYVLPPAYIVPPPLPHYHSPPPIYIAPPPPIIRGVPPTFVPFETGKVVPLPPKVNLYPTD